MPFENAELETIYTEIRHRQVAAGRLSLVSFDDAEYGLLLDWAKQTIRRFWWWSDERCQQARLVFLAFAMAFVRRHKYTDDYVFWPDFEDILELDSMERRFLMMDDLLWPSYQEEGLELRFDGRGRRIVGTLVDEMRQARTWVTQARGQFVEFFQWYYRNRPEAEVTPQLLTAYRGETGKRLLVLDKVLPTLTRDCQLLACVIDYATEHELYLHASRLHEYRRQIISALGPEFDTTRLHLIHDERSLIRLLLELQNHRTPVQLERELRSARGGFVTAPWGERMSVRAALKRWTPFAYGIYRFEDMEYRVVPHPRLRLELLDQWPFEQVIPWRGDRFLAYKKRTSFEVTIGRRTSQATPYIHSRRTKEHVWVDEVPVGQKLAIDGRLRSESAGADWQVSLRLASTDIDHPELCIAVTRLMLYYPDRAHQPLQVWATTGYRYDDSLREDGVRRFHLHRRLVIPLESFDESVQVGVTVDDEVVLQRAFTAEPHYLFSVTSRERVQARGKADLGDLEYLLFSRDASLPHTGPGVNLEILSEPYGAYTIYRVTWDDADQPFELQVGSAHWAFQRRREFSVLLRSEPPPDHLRLKPHQCLQLQDLSLRLYSTLDLSEASFAVDVYGDEGLLGEVDLSPYVNPADTVHYYDVVTEVWDKLGDVIRAQYGRFLLCFRDGESPLGEQLISLVPSPILETLNKATAHPEAEPLQITVVSGDCPVWNPETKKLGERATIWLRARTHNEPLPGHRALRRVVSEPVSTPVSFPDLGETLEIVVHPRLFGFRLFLKRSEQTTQGQWRTGYQPLTQADYYRLDSTTLYVFSAPNSRVELSVGAHVVYMEETDAAGDLLIEGLGCLQEACIDEETHVTLRSGKLRTEFIVRWAPLLKELKLENDEAVLRLNGPEDTAVRLWLCRPSGEVFWTQDVPCRGEELSASVPLPADRPAVTYLVAGYVLSSGEVRPSTLQVEIKVETLSHIPREWYDLGIGLVSMDDLVMIGEPPTVLQ